MRDRMAVNGLRVNNFDLLRFVFAFSVFLFHAYVLSGNSTLKPFADWTSAEFAVKSFFVVSGFLIFMSYENSSSPRRYFSKRFRRIYPAYFSIVVLCSLAGAIVSNLPIHGYFSWDWLKYLMANLVFLNFLHPQLPGVFGGNTVHAVNGALWTLKIEVMFYVSVPLIVWFFRKAGPWQGMAVLYVLSVAYSWLVGMWGAHSDSGLYLELQRQFPGQLMYFIAGAAMFYYFDALKRYWRWLLAASILVLLVRHWAFMGWIEPLALAVTVIYAACIFPYLGNFAKYGDFSYGIYIIHFPILQGMIAFGVIDAHPLAGLLLTTLVVLTMAFLFWHVIEKPFLNRSSHYVEANHG